jgi:hypothetical protein
VQGIDDLHYGYGEDGKVEVAKKYDEQEVVEAEVEVEVEVEEVDDPVETKSS